MHSTLWSRDDSVVSLSSDMHRVNPELTLSLILTSAALMHTKALFLSRMHAFPLSFINSSHTYEISESMYYMQLFRLGQTDHEG